MKKSDDFNVLYALYAAYDNVYRDFCSLLVPSVNKDCFIGVRTQNLRSLARYMLKSGVYKSFVVSLPHKFFEENQLHAFIISGFKDFDSVVDAVDEFLPYVDNWATCDQMSPKIFAKNTEKIFPYVKKWIKSKHVYTVRFGVLALMRYFMGSNFDIKYADMVLNIKTNEYYINMIRAWYFATAAAKHFDVVYPCFEKLDSWTRRRAIQKAIESYRVMPEHKLKLKELRGKL